MQGQSGENAEPRGQLHERGDYKNGKQKMGEHGCDGRQKYKTRPAQISLPNDTNLPAQPEFFPTFAQLNTQNAKLKPVKVEIDNRH